MDDCYKLSEYFVLICVLYFSSAQHYAGDSCVDSVGLEGFCKPIEECLYAQKQLELGILPTTCGFVGSDPIVCCPGPPPQTTTKRPPPPGPSRKPGEAAEYWCTQYEKLCPKFASVIVGGEKVLPAEFPHMAAIGYGSEDNIEWSCGGSLISENFVLTAAHCLHSGKKGPAQWVLLGTEVLNQITVNSPIPKRGQTHPVIRRIRHPDYQPPSKYNDIALLELGSATEENVLSTVSEFLHPACLPTKKRFYINNEAIATGWGRVGFGDDPSLDLLKVELDILDTSICNKTYELEIRTTKLLERGIDSTMICAGVLEGGKDTCQGDSGGPLQFLVALNCMYDIWGVTSFGKICAFENSPSIYTRVTEYIPWIESVVWPLTA